MDQYKMDNNKRVKEVRNFFPGQFVLLDRRLFVGENEKWADKWEGPYVIQRVMTNGVVDILQKGRTLRVNVHRLKHHYALSDIQPLFLIPNLLTKLSDNLLGKNDNSSNLTQQATPSPRARDRPGDLEIVFKDPNPDKLLVSHQDTPFGRHPMVL